MISPPQWIIEKKRDGLALAEEEIRAFVEGYAAGRIPDYQMSALAMAIYFRGMTPEETAVLADAMMRSGDVLDWSDLPGPKVDKHSTGGVGDKLSLILAPLAAACGLVVPMMSGRGLGLTGGTLDKLESIPGFRVTLTASEIRAVLREVGCCMMGQTEAIAPADRKLYALRDVTATVPSIPLIVASIMSKKLAEGAEALVLDVKWGSGAFMRTVAEARDLASALVRVGRQAGRQVTALITDMNQPLGRTAGNALEVREALDILRGAGPDDARGLTLDLCGHMLALGGLVPDPAAGRARAEQVLKSGAALERFRRLVACQGGDARVADEPERLPAASLREPILAEDSGYVALADAGAIGRACALLGAGRSKASDSVDPAAGVSELAKVGQPVKRGETLAVLHANSRAALEAARPLAVAAFRIGPSPIAAPRLVVETLTHSSGSGVRP
jgi:pyrimidine-nucleoside phosphorylase